MDLERALAREARRLSKKVFDPPTIRTAEDIKHILRELDPKIGNPDTGTEIHAYLAAPDDKGKLQTYHVKASTRSATKREMIISAFTAIKLKSEVGAKAGQLHQATEVNGVIMQPADVGRAGGAMSWIDPLIRKWLGARRQDLLICWDLSDGFTYSYDVFTHRLTREPRNA